MTEAEALALLGLGAHADRGDVERAYRKAVDDIQAGGSLDDARRAALFDVETAYRLLIARPEAEGVTVVDEVPKTRRNILLYALVAILLVGIVVIFAWPRRGGEPTEPSVQASQNLDENMAVPLDEGPTTPIKPGAFVQWSAADSPQPTTYSSGDMRITIAPRVDNDGFVAPELRVSVPGMQELVLVGEAAEKGATHRFAVGRLNPAARTDHVILASYSGGAHCCTSIQVAVPSGDKFVVADLGSWDGDGIGEFPKDISGDGVADFVMRDNAFLYAFASYADSWAPPAVYNLVGTRFVNLSRAPAFRPLFVKFRNEAQQACIGSQEEGATRNGACAAYVAAAARLGGFRDAWAEMLNVYDRDFDWTLPNGCRVKTAPCPEDQQIEYADYPDALYAFLVRTGYIPAGTPRPAPPQAEPGEYETAEPL